MDSPLFDIRSAPKPVTFQIMANSYSAWVADVLPDTEIVYAPLHVIKLMNKQKKPLKNKRWLLLRNVENLSTKANGYPPAQGGEA